MDAVSLLSRAIKDTCSKFRPVKTIEAADFAITTDELHHFVLDLLETRITSEEKGKITRDMLKAELLNNNFYNTQICNETGTNEVWLLCKN
jgi:hypothetical protein